jgi:hypothetical protein
MTPRDENLTDEEVQALADSLGISFEVARAIAGAAILSETELPDGQIIDACPSPARLPPPAIARACAREALLGCSRVWVKPLSLLDSRQPA